MQKNTKNTKIRYRDSYDDYDDSEQGIQKPSKLVTIINILAVVIVLIIVYVIAHKPNFEDTIKVIKDRFINMQLVTIAITTVLIVGLSLLPLKKEKKMKPLLVLTIITIIVIICVIMMKMKLDKTYNYECFKNLYYERNIEGLYSLPIGASDLKELYINEQLKLYSFFNLKVIGCFILHIFVFVINAYKILKKSDLKKDKKVDNIEEK